MMTSALLRKGPVTSGPSSRKCRAWMDEHEYVFGPSAARQRQPGGGRESLRLERANYMQTLHSWNDSK